MLFNMISMKCCYDPKFLLLMSEMSVDHKHSAPSLGVGVLGQPNDGWNFGISHLNTSCRYDGRSCRSRFVTRFYYHQTTQNLCYCVNIFVVYIKQSQNNLFIGFTHQWFQTRITKVEAGQRQIWWTTRSYILRVFGLWKNKATVSQPLSH